MQSQTVRDQQQLAAVDQGCKAQEAVVDSCIDTVKSFGQEPRMNRAVALGLGRTTEHQETQRQLRARLQRHAGLHRAFGSEHLAVPAAACAGVESDKRATVCQAVRRGPSVSPSQLLCRQFQARTPHGHTEHRGVDRRLAARVEHLQLVGALLAKS